MKLIKNPIFWAFFLLLVGMIIGAWGWDKHESTIAERTTFSTPMMVAGCVMIVSGLILMFTQGNRKSNN